MLVVGCDIFGLMNRALQNVSPQPTVKFIKHVTDSDLANLCARATCLIQASYHEGFGLPVVEAMSVGCPVVASDISVLREIAGDAAIYFPVESDNELSDAIIRLLAEDGLREHLSDAGKVNAARFRWSCTADQTSELFSEVLRQGC